MDFRSVIETVSQAAEKSNPRTPDDYEIDGFLICGKCHTKKQTEVTVGGEKIRVWCLCKCKCEEAEAEEKEKYAKGRAERIKAMRSEAFPSPHLQGWTIDKAADDAGELMRIVKDYVAHFEDSYKEGSGLIFCGNVGTGKTYAAACIVNALIDKGWRCKMTSISSIVSEMESWKVERQQILDELNDYALLVLDDIGAERDSDYMQAKVFDIIDARAKSGKPLICTTNLTEKELTKPRGIAGERIYSRLLMMCTPVTVEGKDRRKGYAENRNGFWRRILGLKGDS